MLDDFKFSQPVAYSLVTNSILSGKLSHAYLVNANNYNKAYDFVLSMVKMIICENHRANSSQCEKCNICQRISDGNYPEVKVIQTDSMVIKKEQLLELQSEFTRSSIEGNYRIYIIKDCDKMNKQASNCLLKFLEEPVPGIIAILLTNRFASILSTIISRCQIINLVNDYSLNGKSAFENLAILCCDTQDNVISFLNDDNNKEFVPSILSFIDYFEENGLDVLIFMKKMWYNKFQTREVSELAFLLLLYFYYDLLKYKFHLEDYFFCDQLDMIQKISNFNSVDDILHKIEVVHYGLDMVKCNLNMNLLIDDIVIRLGDRCEYS